MVHDFSRTSQWCAVAAAIGSAIVWRLGAFSVWGVAPNVMLVAILLAAFFVRDPLLFAWSGAGVLLLAAYAPFFQVEYLLLAAIGVVGFLFARAFVFERKLGFFIGAVAIAQVAWWVGVGYGGGIFTISFVLEFLYNAIVASALFFVVVWLEETFS